MSELEDSFTKLLGRQPSDTERQQLYRVKDALGLKNNDAMWLILMSLQHYQTQYEQFPAAISKAAQDVLANVKITADAAMNASAEETKAALTTAVEATAKEIANNTSRKQMLQWICGCVAIIGITFGGFGWYMHDRGSTQGFNSGYGYGYKEAKDEKAAAAWANTPEGKLAYRLAQSANIKNLATCTGNGWSQENGACFVRTASDGSIYGWKLPN